MSKLSTIISYEYSTEVRNKSFWIGTFVMPILLVGFGIFVGYLAADSETLTSFTSNTKTDPDDLTGAQVAGMLSGMMLVLFLMIFGAMIFNKVKQEKTNRIAEILASCVPGRTLITAKIISVGLIGLTQLTVWFLMLGGGFIVLLLLFSIPLTYIGFSFGIIWRLVCTLLYFIGGYIMYGSMYAICGAVTDKNGENQQYMTIITFILLAGFYVGMYTADNPTSTIALWCNYIPFTSPCTAVSNTIAGNMAWWQTLISLIVLYGSAAFSLTLAGKLYSSAMLLQGKKLGPKDFITFLKSK